MTKHLLSFRCHYISETIYNSALKECLTFSDTWQITPKICVVSLYHLSIFCKGSRLVLWCAEMRLWPAVVILRCGVKVTVMMLVVVLWGGVVVVMMTVDVCIGEEEGCGWWRLVGGHNACSQRSIALDRAVPTRCSQLGRGGKKTEGKTQSEIIKSDDQVGMHQSNFLPITDAIQSAPL